MQLRPYQEELVAKVRQSMASGNKRVLLQSPTGSGKTVTFTHIVGNAIAKGKKVLVLAHREELILQAHKTLWKSGVKAGVIMANYEESPNLPVQVASVQTLVRRLDRRYPDFDLIVCDECHHAKADTYTKIFTKWHNAYILGVTATPCRIDGKGLGDLFNDLVHGPQIADLIEQGSLVKPIYVSTPAIDLSGVKVTAGDYNKKQLAEAIKKAHINGDLVAHWLEHAQGLQTIVFAVDVAHSEEIIANYREAGINAEHVDANTPKELRTEIIRKFSNGEITVLSNVGIFTEGFDVPGISCVQIARPTKSISLYFQMVGRALRPAPNKEHAVILDHAGLFHDLGDVSMPVVWELKQSKLKRAIARDEISIEKQERIINFDGSIQLVKMAANTDEDWVQYLRVLLAHREQNNYKKAWVAHKFVDEYPNATVEQMRIVAKALGYHYRWADRFVESAAG